MQTEAVATQWPELVRLRDGSEVFVRPIDPDDKAQLLRGFERLSPESRYRRFLVPMTRLSPRMLRYLTEVDHHDHEALVAESVEGTEPVGVARYIRLVDDPSSAEVAVAVVDDWQGKGVATALVRRLAQRAMQEGVERFSATCLASNTDVLDLLGDVGSKRVTPTKSGLVEVEISLPTSDEKPMLAALRSAAAGAFTWRHPVERNQSAGRSK